MQPPPPTEPDTNPWRPAFLALLVVVTLLLLWPRVPTPGGAEVFPYADKAVHAGLFALLGAVASRAWPDAQAGRLFALLMIYGGITELAQGLVPPRAPDTLDWAADGVGALVVFVPPMWRRVSRSR